MSLKFTFVEAMHVYALYAELKKRKEFQDARDAQSDDKFTVELTAQEINILHAGLTYLIDETVYPVILTELGIKIVTEKGLPKEREAEPPLVEAFKDIKINIINSNLEQ